MNQNADGTFSWKFDNYVRNRAPYNVTGEELVELWSNITCPILHVYGNDSWMEDPETAGHWVHHDQLDAFVETVRKFFQEP